MKLRRVRTSLTRLSPLVALVIACGPNPKGAGDECDPADGCPDGLVCAPSGGESLCFDPPGGPCEVGADDFCLDDALCSADGVCEVPLGGECDPGVTPEYCEGDAVCGEIADGEGLCGIGEGGACDPADSLCAGGLTCAELQAGGHACYLPVLLRGRVFDSESDVGIEGALVLALDDQSTALTDVEITGLEGAYDLELPIARDDDGVPIPDVVMTLRSSAAGYQPFPGGLRTALPITSGEAVALDEGYVIETAITDIALIALPPDQQGLASISGTVLAGERSAGVLVVAEGAGGGQSAVSDLSGAYTIFNVPAGGYDVRGYAAGVQLVPASATVASDPLVDVDLAESSDALGSISGSINIVNAPGGSATSVVLVVESTFSDTFVRGEVPRGLRTPLSGPPDVTGEFMIADVPAGRYVVLAAFENDDLVRDPDPNIAGTQIVTVEMTAPGDAVALSDSFKITEALAVIGPGVDEAEPVSAPPDLQWADDSSEDFYTVVVYNAYGDRVWCLSDQMADCDGPNIPGVSGAEVVSVPYEGPLDPGMYYQFRATSWRAPGGNAGPIATTEDLRGVFFSGG